MMVRPGHRDGDDHSEVVELRARLKWLTRDLAHPPKGEEDRERLETLRAEAKARLRDLEKRLGGGC